MKFKQLAYALILSLAGIGSQAFSQSITCNAFEPYPLGSTYPVGTNQTFNNIFAELTAFQWSNGIWTNAGIAVIEDGLMAQGSGQEVELNNINYRLIFEDPKPYAATFKYADFGGNVNLGINGTLSNVNDMSDLNGSIVNGVLITVTRTEVFGGHYGTVALISIGEELERFGFGGQEFWSDDVCAYFP